MFKFKKKKLIKNMPLQKKLTKEDLSLFYILLNKLNPISGIIGIITKDFYSSVEYLEKKYDKTYTKIANAETKAIIIVKEDFLVKYIVLESIDEIINSDYKFSHYI